MWAHSSCCFASDGCTMPSSIFCPSYSNFMLPAFTEFVLCLPLENLIHLFFLSGGLQATLTIKSHLHIFSLILSHKFSVGSSSIPRQNSMFPSWFLTSHTSSHTPQLTPSPSFTLYVPHQSPTLWDSGWPGASRVTSVPMVLSSCEACDGMAPLTIRINLTLPRAGLFHWLSCDQSLEQIQIMPARMSSSRSILKNNCKQEQSDIVHAEHFVIAHYKFVHYCNIPAWKGTQMALPEKQDWVQLSASHKTCQDLNKEQLFWALFTIPMVF